MPLEGFQLLLEEISQEGELILLGQPSCSNVAFYSYPWPVSPFLNQPSLLCAHLRFLLRFAALICPLGNKLEVMVEMAAILLVDGRLSGGEYNVTHSSNV
jgi:hypothetical protein